MTNDNDSTVSVLRGNGSGGFGAKTDFATGAGPFSAAVADFNRDGKPDIVTANYGAGANTASVLLNSTVITPKIGALKPTHGKVGATVTITGTGFWSRRGTAKVYFGAKATTRYVSWSATKIRVRVPKLAKGKKRVTVRTADGKSNAKMFTVK